MDLDAGTQTRRFQFGGAGRGGRAVVAGHVLGALAVSRAAAAAARRRPVSSW
jgi:hypothetical protein